MGGVMSGRNSPFGSQSPRDHSFELRDANQASMESIDSHRRREGHSKDWRPHWVDDTQVDQCTECHCSFGLQIRKHHCRLCGGVFCSQCTTNRTPLHYHHYTHPVRVCEACFSVIAGRSLSFSSQTETQAYSARLLQKTIQRKLHQSRIVEHALPPLVQMGGKGNSLTLLYYVSYAFHIISSDLDLHLMLYTHHAAPALIRMIEQCSAQAVSLGEELNPLPVRRTDNREVQQIEEEFSLSRRAILHGCHALLALASNPNLRTHLAEGDRLERILQLCLDTNPAYTDEIHDSLLQTILELATHEDICLELMKFEDALSLVLSLAAAKDHDILQITSLNVLLIMAKCSEEHRRSIVDNEGLEVICLLLNEDTPGPQRRIAMQILLELAQDEVASEELVFRYAVPRPLTRYLMNKPGLKERNLSMIVKVLVALGRSESLREEISRELNTTIGELTRQTEEITPRQMNQIMRAIRCLSSMDWVSSTLRTCPNPRLLV